MNIPKNEKAISLKCLKEILNLIKGILTVDHNISYDGDVDKDVRARDI